MESKTRELITILEKLIMHHRALLTVEQKKVHSIINQDMQELDSLILQSRKILKDIETSEKARRVIVKELCGTDKATITEIGYGLSEAKNTELSLRANSLKSLMLEQKELNQSIEYLLKDSLDIINLSVSIFSGADPYGKTYSVAGEERSIVDKPASMILDIKA